MTFELLFLRARTSTDEQQVNFWSDLASSIKCLYFITVSVSAISTHADSRLIRKFSSQDSLAQKKRTHFSPSRPEFDSRCSALV